MIEIADVKQALPNIRPFVHRTPLILSRSLSEMSGAEVYLKVENLQKTGSFKVRGAFNRMSGLKHGDRVIAASMGNHAQAVAYAANRLGLSAKIVMPVTSPLSKQEATKGYGADVELVGEQFQDALDHALAQRDRIFIAPFDDDRIMAGQGTIGLEIAEELDKIDAVLVPIGGGGLISGIATVFKAISPKTEIIGVQTEAAPSAHDSLRARRPIPSPPKPTLADGIAIGRVGDRPFEVIGTRVDDILLVSEEAIAGAIVLFLERKKLVVEGAGAVPLAALLDQAPRFQGRRVVLVVSGGNIDLTLMDRILHRGLATRGRVGTFTVAVGEATGDLARVLACLARHRAPILDITYDRLSQALAVGKAAATFVVETRDHPHLKAIVAELESEGLRPELSKSRDRTETRHSGR